VRLGLTAADADVFRDAKRAAPWHPGLVEVRQSADTVGGATVQLSAVELSAVFNILGFVARRRSIAEKSERDMAAEASGTT
jgi:hypothetical protein